MLRLDIRPLLEEESIADRESCRSIATDEKRQTSQKRYHARQRKASRWVFVGVKRAIEDGTWLSPSKMQSTKLSFEVAPRRAQVS
jgi:hypothetical protein